VATLVRLFVNHRPAPAKSLTLDSIDGAFAALSTTSADGATSAITLDDLVETLTASGEQLSDEELAMVITSLLHTTPLEDVLGRVPSAAKFANVLGF
jgi:hypothetical protein